ncbi:DNA-binding protein HEXBP-like [Camellia sinensis]|uniref:DNA-binding protein HEXBP-like n=1 Tax=Camellia sinensis TaxID=4442 RepID=UPI00103588F3|nr:DNA-binding protein HEXBP-like [Camellia sinensis]
MIRDYDRLVETAAHVEIMVKTEEVRPKLKRTGHSEFKGDMGSSKRSRGSSSSFHSPPQQPKSSDSVIGRSSGSVGRIHGSCYRCGQLGHKASECGQKSGTQSQHTRPQGQSQNRGQLSSCYQCGQTGHLKKSCPQRAGTTSVTGSRQSRGF